MRNIQHMARQLQLNVGVNHNAMDKRRIPSLPSQKICTRDTLSVMQWATALNMTVPMCRYSDVCLGTWVHHMAGIKLASKDNLLIIYNFFHALVTKHNRVVNYEVALTSVSSKYYPTPCIRNSRHPSSCNATGPFERYHEK